MRRLFKLNTSNLRLVQLKAWTKLNNNKTNLCPTQSFKLKENIRNENFHINYIILTINNLLLSLCNFLSHLPEDLLLDCFKISIVANSICKNNIVKRPISLFSNTWRRMINLVISKKADWSAKESIKHLGNNVLYLLPKRRKDYTWP